MEQTNRTILFEKINPQKGDLFTLIGENNKKESLTDERISDIHRHLEVSSFEEFIDKFSPGVNMMLDTDNRMVAFSLDDLGPGQHRININQEDSLFRRLMQLIEAKYQKKYLLTGFEDLFQNVLPCDDFSAFYGDRYSYIRSLADLKEENREYYKCALKKILQKQDEGIYLLNVFLDNTWYVLSDLPKERTINRGILQDNGRLQIKILRKSARYCEGYFIEENFDVNEYERIVTECINEMDTIRNKVLLKDCFLIPVYIQNGNLEALTEKYNIYSDFLTFSIKKYWVTVKPLMETMLGVWNFFMPYAGCDGMKPVLVVTNFAIAELLDKKNKDKLDIYLNSVNMKNYIDNTIWYAIVPNVITQNEIQNRNVRERFRSQKEQYRYYRNETEEVLLLVEMLGRYRIQSFLSFALTEENTFSHIAVNGIDAVNRNLHAFEKMEQKDYLVPCFPNFTVVPENAAYLNVREKNLWLDEIGVEASYVAAGLFAACQCPKYLKKFYKKGVNEDFPGVSYRFSEDNHNLQTTTHLFGETIKYSGELMEEMQLRSRGVLFGQKDGRVVVLTDRAYSYSSGNQLLVAMVQTTVYMERVIQYKSQDFKKNLISQFFQRIPGSMLSRWYTNDAASVNGILRENERIEYKISETEGNCTFSVHFKNNSQVRNDTVAMFKE